MAIIRAPRSQEWEEAVLDDVVDTDSYTCINTHKGICVGVLYIVKFAFLFQINQ